MTQRFPTYALVVLVLGSVATTGCERMTLEVTSPGPVSPVSSSVQAEPLTVHPAFVHGSCPSRPAFEFRLTLVISGNHDVILYGVRFGFTDRFGGSFFPTTLPDPSAAGSMLPSSGPVTLPGIAAIPGASPIPIPGSGSLHGVLVPGGRTGRVPFFLRFGCGIVPDGTLTITADTADPRGQSHTSQIRVRVGP